MAVRALRELQGEESGCERAQLMMQCVERSCVVAMTCGRISSDKHEFAGVSRDLPVGAVRRDDAQNRSSSLPLDATSAKDARHVDGMRT